MVSESPVSSSINRYRVFISSTIQGLEGARACAVTALNSLEIFEPRRAEDLPASDMPSRVVCLDEVHAADIVVLITGDRYGFVPNSNNPENLSVTHLEYREAKRLHRPVFAFIFETETPDEPLRKFLNEVEDFDSGVFRRKWKTTEGLKGHIQRSLLWWIARIARRNEPLRVNVSTVVSELHKAHLKTLPVHIETASGGENAMLSVRESLEVLASRTTSGTLLPVLQETTAKDSAAIAVSVEPLQVPYEFGVTTRANIAGEEEIAIHLKIRPGSSTVTILAEMFSGLRYLLVDDPGASVEVLLHLSDRGDLDTDGRAALVGLSVQLSERYNLEKALEGGERLLKFDKVDQRIIALVGIALLKTIVRFGRKNLFFAKRQTEFLYVRVLTKSLHQGTGGPEEIYTLSRKALEAGLRVGAQLYFDLLKVHPYYEERWYWHRDLGLYYYRQGDLRRAAAFYDKASELKPDYALLDRLAGDAYYYQGKWVAAMTRFEKAVSKEPTEKYALDMKIVFARTKVAAGVVEERNFRPRHRIAELVSRVGVFLETHNARFLAPIFFRVAYGICELNFSGAKWRALYANRRGDHKQAIHMLSICLAGTPEDPAVRLNLVANMIFANEGKLTADARKHLAAAIFNGGPRTRERFAVSLINTSTSAALLGEFDEVMNTVKTEWEAAQLRKYEITKPTKFGQALHIEANH